MTMGAWPPVKCAASSFSTGDRRMDGSVARCPLSLQSPGRCRGRGSSLQVTTEMVLCSGGHGRSGLQETLGSAGLQGASGGVPGLLEKVRGRGEIHCPRKGSLVSVQGTPGGLSLGVWSVLKNHSSLVSQEGTTGGVVRVQGTTGNSASP